MLIKRRSNVFETNSSSMHSVSYSPSSSSTMNLEEIRSKIALSSDQKVIYGSFGEFGWGYDVLSSFGEKLEYVLTSIRYHDNSAQDEQPETVKESKYFKWLSELLEQVIGCTLDLKEGRRGETVDIGYIDHQSTDTLDEYFQDETTFKTKMIPLLFDNNCTIIIDNDNH